MNRIQYCVLLFVVLEKLIFAIRIRRLLKLNIGSMKEGLEKEYVSDIKKQIGKVDYIFLSTDIEGLKLLKGFNIVLDYPENNLRNEYLDRFIDRDSPYDFIGTFMKHWNIWIDELKDQNYCKHIILKNGEYLQNIL